MARHVTVSCVTARPLALGRDVGFDQAIRAEIDHWTDRIEAVLPEEPDLIVLPEACDRPDPETFGSDRMQDYYRARHTQVRSHLASMSLANHCVIAYSSPQIDDDRSANRTEFIDTNGTIVGGYNKNHLVIDEHDRIGLDYGHEIGVVDLAFGRVGAVICFDLNFDELRKKYEGQGVELLVFSSEYHGGLMQNYWAYSLRSYLAASIRPPAPSAIVSPQGETVAESTNYFAHVTSRINLDYALVHLDGHWGKLRAAKNKYRDGIRIHDPGRLGSVLISSEDPAVPTSIILEEFEMEQFDAYLERCRLHRNAHLDKQ